MKTDDINSEDDLRKYIKIYRHKIFVREQIDGSWQSVSLQELSPASQFEWEELFVQRFLENGRIPVRIL